MCHENILWFLTSNVLDKVQDSACRMMRELLVHSKAVRSDARVVGPAACRMMRELLDESQESCLMRVSCWMVQLLDKQKFKAKLHRAIHRIITAP